MTYQEILTYLYGLGRFGIKPGLGKIKTLLNSLSNPQECLKVIHIAGTNGKGSTAAFLSAILAAGGYKTGLFTSPHLVAFTERIRINGAEIAESDVVSVAKRVMAAAPEGTTFFEMATAMAILYFAEQGTDAVVLETGMGGRLDATNAAPKILSVITPIAFDHCEYLGDTIEAIAGEKAGIIQAGTPVVVSPQPEAALGVIRNVCATAGSPLFTFGTDFAASWTDSKLCYCGLDWNLEDLQPGIAGRYQAANAAAALCASELLARQGFALDPKVARAGVEKASWPGRMEIVGTSPRVLLDGAHNPAGAAALAEAVADIPRQRLLLVLGVMSGKDVEGIISRLAPLADTIITVTPGMPQAFPSSALAEKCATAGARAVDAGSVSAGLELALRSAGTADVVLVCGSLFVVGEARAILFSRKFQPCRG